MIFKWHSMPMTNIQYQSCHLHFSTTHGLGCNGVAPLLVNETTKTIPVPATAPFDNQTCIADTDCMPARCCHPTNCAGEASIDACNFPYTTSYGSPVDCGAGTCWVRRYEMSGKHFLTGNTQHDRIPAAVLSSRVFDCRDRD